MTFKPAIKKRASCVFIAVNGGYFVRKAHNTFAKSLRPALTHTGLAGCVRPEGADRSPSPARPPLSGPVPTDRSINWRRAHKSPPSMARQLEPNYIRSRSLLHFPPLPNGRLVTHLLSPQNNVRPTHSRIIHRPALTQTPSGERERAALFTAGKKRDNLMVECRERKRGRKGVRGNQTF